MQPRWHGSPPATAATAAASSSADTSAENTDHYIDAVVLVGAKDLPLLRYSLRHMLRYVANLHTVFVVTQDTITAKSVVAQTNAFQTAHSEGALPRVELFPESRFPVTMALVRDHLQTKRRWNGTICCRNGVPEHRLGWYLQQFLKLGAAEAIPGIRDYVVVDADVIFHANWTVMDTASASVSASATTTTTTTTTVTTTPTNIIASTAVALGVRYIYSCTRREKGRRVARRSTRRRR